MVPLIPLENNENNKIKIYNFNTTWCGHSINFQPIWDSFSKSLIESDNITPYDIKCDDDTHKNLIEKYKIEGYPTIIIDRGDNFIKYSGKRTVNDIRSELNLKPINLDNKNENNENNENNKKIKIYNFNTTWCSHSINFQPIWELFSKSLLKSDNITTYDVKCDDDFHKKLIDKYKIEGYPTIIIDYGNEFIKYSGKRTVNDIRTALKLKPIILDDINNKIKIYNFNTTWCGHSINFQPIWDSFSKSLIESDNITPYDIKCDDDSNKKLTEKYNVNGYPTVIIDYGNKFINYSGKRTVNDIRAVLNLKPINEDNDKYKKIMITNIEEFNNTNTKIFNFNTTWCGHSMKFQPIWDEFSKSLLKYDNISAYDVKCDNNLNKKLIERYSIEGFPTIIIDYGDKFIKYSGTRTVNGLRSELKLKPINDSTDNIDNAVKCGNTIYTRPPKIIDQDNLTEINDNDTIIYNFNTSWCGYSIKFQSIWDEFSNKNKNSNIKIIDVKCDNNENEKLCNKYPVDGYPSVLKVTNKKIIPYNGPRTVAGLEKFANE